jgi:GNAT superfamily N-acetyltransferase
MAMIDQRAGSEQERCSAQPAACLPASSALDQSVAAQAWTYGWAICRHTDAPIPCAGYFRIFVGKPEQVTRYVLPHLDHELLRRLVCTEAAPGTWLKVCASVESVSPLLSSRWHIHDPEFLMSTNRAGRCGSALEGYRLHTEQVGALMLAKLIADTGELAASGQAAIDGGFATFDQIVTAEAHRRKGLGRCIMAALSNCALKLKATRGVLVATEAGAALYQALGWTLVTPVTAASVPQRK